MVKNPIDPHCPIASNPFVPGEASILCAHLPSGGKAPVGKAYWNPKKRVPWSVWSCGMVATCGSSNVNDVELSVSLHMKGGTSDVV